MRRHAFCALVAALCMGLCGCSRNAGAKVSLEDEAVGSCWQLDSLYYNLRYDYALTYLFFSEDYYSICPNFVSDKRNNNFGSHGIFTGKYVVSGDTVTLDYPEDDKKKNGMYSWILPLVFGGEETATFTYDPGYADFYYSTCLRNGSLVMRNLTKPCEAGGVYELEGMEVVKTEPVRMTVTEGVPLYSEPRFGAAAYHYRYNLYPPLSRKGARLGREPSGQFLPGFITYYDARSTGTYAGAGGREGRWYHVHLSTDLLMEANEADEIEWCWIFTDSIVLVEEGDDEGPYDALLEEAATASGAIAW